MLSFVNALQCVFAFFCVALTSCDLIWTRNIGVHVQPIGCVVHSFTELSVIVCQVKKKKSCEHSVYCLCFANETKSRFEDLLTADYVKTRILRYFAHRAPNVTTTPN